ncbi:MAG: glycosyltransferase [Candidatus Eisenbacteria bacterium]|nr:glycosyltransferase [Candidatus Eisenbacteria bacterium]
MKVLAANKYYFVKGGAERYFFELSRILAEHGHEIVPFAMDDERNEATPWSRYFVSHEPFENGTPVLGRLAAAGRVLYSWEARRKIERLVDRTEPDVAHLHNIAHQLSPSILHGLASRGVPIVQTLHDYKLVCPNYQMFVDGATCERCETFRYYRAIAHRCMRGSLLASTLVALEAYVHRIMGTYLENVDLFIAPSRSLRDRMIAHGVPGEQIVHMPYSIALDEYEPRHEPQNYGVCFGRLSGGKGLRTLVEALRKVPELPFRIVGSGPMREELERLAAGLDHVEFTGYMTGERLHRVVADALFAVVPSECYENSPLAVYESFALGTPVIGSTIGGIPELVTHGECGLHFPTGDAEALAEAMRDLSADRGRAVEMGRAARRRVETEYGPARHYELITSIYERVTQ